MIVVERIRYYHDGVRPSYSIAFIAGDDVDLAHQAKALLQINEKIDELIEDLKG